MTARKVLVMGASGNVGACVVRQLVAQGDDVAVLLRRTSSTQGIDGLEVQRHYGDMFDTDAVREAMTGCKLPVYVRGVGSEVVGIDDAARARILAADRGRVGERYIVSEGYMTQREMLTTAAQAVGARPPRFGIPMAPIYVMGWLLGMSNRLFGTDFPMNLTAARLIWLTSPASHTKAIRDLGWQPARTEQFIARAAQCYVERRDRGVKVIDL